MKSGWQFALLITVAFLASPLLALAQIAEIGGYDRYKFGMALAEAQAVNPTAKKTPCDFVGVAFCLEYDTEISAFPARVDVQFSGTEPRIFQIVLTFDSLKVPVRDSCVQVGRELLKLLKVKYGPHPMMENHKATWSSPNGGSVELSPLCVTESLGVTIVAYRKTGRL